MSVPLRWLKMGWVCSLPSPCFFIWHLRAVSWTWHMESQEFGPWVQNSSFSFSNHIWRTLCKKHFLSSCRNLLQGLRPLAYFILSTGENITKKLTLLGLGDQKTKWASTSISHESTVSPISYKRTGGFTSHGLLGMPRNATRPINRRLSQNCVYFPADMCQKTTLP
jgi:hypothetical protein